LQANNVLRLKWNKQSCTLNVELPEGDKDEIARVGPVLLRGEAMTALRVRDCATPRNLRWR
jgi:hypothetical protein